MKRLDVMLRPGSAVCAALIGVACSPAAEPIGASQSSVVYGTDDRIELAAARDPMIRDLGAQYTLALIPHGNLRLEGNGVTVDSPSLQEQDELCPDEAFGEQPAAAICTGVVVGPNLVLTAGHCISDQILCRDGFSLIRGYVQPTNGSIVRVRADDVFECETVLAYRNDPYDASPSLDYALLRTTRAIAEQGTPLGPVTDPLTIIGASQGLPLKVQPEVHITSYGAGYLEVEADTFHGDSGAPAFSPDGSLVGIVSGGEGDYEQSSSESCTAVRRIDSPGRERITLIRDIAQDACAQGAQLNPSLCPTGGGETGCAVTAPNVQSRGTPLDFLMLSPLVFVLRSRRISSRTRRGQPQNCA